MNVFIILYKIVTLHSVYSLYYLGDYVNMVRLVLLDFLLRKHPLRIRKSLDDALFGPCRTLYNVTLVLAVGSPNCTNI